jgi:hypothetical protein
MNPLILNSSPQKSKFQNTIIGKVPGYTPAWTSGGVGRKPTECGLCPWSKKGIGFVGDLFPPEAKVLFVFDAPISDDAIEQVPMKSGMGRMHMYNLVYSIGRKKSEVAISYLQRCAYPKKGKFPLYPTGEIKKKSEKRCRVYDKSQWLDGERSAGGVLAFNPDIFLLTFDADAAINGPAFTHLLRADCRKAFEIADKGYKVAVLFGKIAGAYWMPHAFKTGAGGLKGWRGHYMKADWGKGFSQLGSW